MKTYLALLLTLAVVALGVNADGLYEKSDLVRSLSAKTFANEVFASPDAWLIEFYAPWCGHCQRLAPEYIKAAQNLDGIVSVGAVNCDEEEMKPLCGHFKVQGFPTILGFRPEVETVKSPDGNIGLQKAPVPYEDQRTAAPIARFALNLLNDKNVHIVTAATEADFYKFEGEPQMSDGSPLKKVLLFTNKKSPSGLYKSLATHFDNRLALGQVLDTETAIVEKYNIKSYPSLIVLNGEEVVPYEGELKGKALREFLEPFCRKASPSTLKGAFQEAGGPQKGAKSAPPPPPPEEKIEVRELTSTEQLSDLCLKKRKLCAIAFFDEETKGDHPETTLLNVANKYPKLVNFFYLDGSKQPELLEFFDLHTGFPSLVVISPSKKQFSHYLGSFQESSMAEWFGRVSQGSKKALRSFQPLDVDKIPPLN